MEGDVRATAQAQAEKAFANFILWSKRTTYAAVAFLLIVVNLRLFVNSS